MTIGSWKAIPKWPHAARPVSAGRQATSSPCGCACARELVAEGSASPKAARSRGTQKAAYDRSTATIEGADGGGSPAGPQPARGWGDELAWGPRRGRGSWAFPLLHRRPPPMTPAGQVDSELGPYGPRLPARCMVRRDSPKLLQATPHRSRKRFPVGCRPAARCLAAGNLL